MACTASSGCAKVTVPIPRLLPSLSSLTSARLTAPAMANTSFNFFQPTLKSNYLKKIIIIIVNMNHDENEVEFFHAWK